MVNSVNKKTKTDLKQQLDNYVKQYETKDFIKDDPIQFCHRFKNPKDIELAGFIASLFAFGNRKIFINKLNELFEIFQNEPCNFIENYNGKSLNGFNYRFAKENDVIVVLSSLNKLYKHGDSLMTLFQDYFEKEKDIFGMLCRISEYFYKTIETSCGAKYLIPDARKKCAMKRMNMFLRWMVRKSNVDLGLWSFIPTSDILIPLDTHVARISRNLNLLKRNSNDFKAVIELTNNLKLFDKNDPVKYDFALFGYGVNEK